jgi:hypothetical protein
MNCLEHVARLLAISTGLLLLTGCATTTMKLSGTAGSAFSGHYVLRGATNTLSGSVPMEVEISGIDSLQSCEFRKARLDDTLVLEIYQGKRQTLRAPVSPGTLGVRAAGEGRANWHFETIK